MNDKASILHKELNLGFVYVFIFLVGLIIVTCMISYINAKVNEISNSYTINDNY